MVLAIFIYIDGELHTVCLLAPIPSCARLLTRSSSHIQADPFMSISWTSNLRLLSKNTSNEDVFTIHADSIFLRESYMMRNGNDAVAVARTGELELFNNK